MKTFQTPKKGESIKSRLEAGDICDRTGHLGRAKIRKIDGGWEVYVYSSGKARRFDHYWRAIEYFNRCVGYVKALHPDKSVEPDG